MSKECPHCHEEVRAVFQCEDSECGMMYCDKCARNGWTWTVIGPLPVARKCPQCGSERCCTVSVDDDAFEETLRVVEELYAAHEL